MIAPGSDQFQGQLATFSTPFPRSLGCNENEETSLADRKKGTSFWSLLCFLFPFSDFRDELSEDFWMALNSGHVLDGEIKET